MLILKKRSDFMASITTANAFQKSRLSVKAQTLAALAAIASAVAVPQLFHTLGAVSGLGTALGETFLPMQLPVMLTGLLAGPYAGLAAGTFGPLASFALSGMPGSLMLPFMMIELAFYGLSTGLLANTKLPLIGKVFASQVIGRIARAAAILAAVYALGNESIHVSIIWKSISAGLPGLVLQWSLLPLTVFWVENRAKNDQ